MAAAREFRFVARTLLSFSSPYCTKLFVHSNGVNTGKMHLSTIIKIHACSQTSRIYRKSERYIKHWRCLSNVCKIDEISFYTRSPKNTRTERLNYERRKSFPLCKIQTHPLKCSVGAFHESAIKANDAEKKGEENTKNSVTGNKFHKTGEQDTVKENILTVPNALTVSRIVLSPFLGYVVLHESYTWALGLFVYAGTTDWIDGYIARKFPSQRSALGSLIDPLGDKILMTILTVTLTQVDLLPFPLAALIIGRDVALLTGGIYIRYRMLPPPKTLSRIFNPSLSSHNVNPTVLSKKENILTVPNALTVSRIVLSPFLGYVVLHESYTWALGLFVYAETTDWIDGYIARKFPSQRSALGSLIDPLGDKILMTILTVTLTQVDLLPFPLAALIIGRDVALLTGGIYIRYRMLPPPKTLSRIFNPSLSSHNVNPTVLSKFNTFCQISLIAATLGAPVFNYVDHTVLHGMWYVTGATTLLSGLSYVFSNDTYSSIQNKNSTKER